MRKAGAKEPGTVPTAAVRLMLGQSLTVRCCPAADSKFRPVGAAEEHFDTCSLARCLELASGLFGQSSLQDIDQQ